MSILDVPRYEIPVRVFVTNGNELLNWLESKARGDSDVEFSNIAIRTTRVAMEIMARGWRKRLRSKAIFEWRNKNWAVKVFRITSDYAKSDLRDRRAEVRARWAVDALCLFYIRGRRAGPPFTSGTDIADLQSIYKP